MKPEEHICQTCKHKQKGSYENPCAECMNNGGDRDRWKPDTKK